MLTNYIKIALRNILRNKLHSFINIIGLSMGMAGAILFLLFVQDELSYDRHNSKHDRIYMVQTPFRVGDGEEFSYATSFVMGPTLKDEYPAVEEFVRTYLSDRIFFIDKKKEIIGEDGICYADPEVFKVFDHKFIYGSSEDSLESLHSIVLSESLAKKYFGDQNPVGRILSRNNGIDYSVTGVFEDLPRNTFRRYTALMPMIDLVKIEGAENFESRESCAFYRSTAKNYTYILLHENTDIKSITEDSDRFREKYFIECGKQINYDLKLYFESLTDVRLYFKPRVDSPPGILIYIVISSLAALIFLIIACINYMNLATARSAGRAREVGIRKVLGADRSSIARQFLIESIIITIVALLFALVLIELFLPSFNNLFGKEMSFGVFAEPVIFSGLLIITLIVGLLAGSYPAFFLSSYLPIKVIKGDIESGRGKGKLRNILVFVQFTISIIVIIGAILTQNQVEFMRHMDLGFDKEGIIVITPSDTEAIDKLPALKNMILGNSEIMAVARSNYTAAGNPWQSNFLIENSNGEMVTKLFSYVTVDFDFIDLMELETLEGRSFNREMGTDQTEAVLVNETLVKEMGWTDSPIGKHVNWMTKGKIIGVLKDFHFQPLYQSLLPMIVMLNENEAKGKNPVLSVKIHPENSKKTIEFIKNKWFELNPMQPFEHTFLKNNIDSLYQTDEAVGRIFGYTAFLTIFISCLGLFGLSSFVAEKKTKEIGIRKVHGASVWNILYRLTCDFTKLVLASGIVAWLIIIFIIEKLSTASPYAPEGFPWVSFIITLCIPMFFALVTVSYHAIKASLIDPVKALRYE